jgi:hypothetical protein
MTTTSNPRNRTMQDADRVMLYQPVRRQPTRKARPSNRVVTGRMPASVHSLVDATRKPSENADAEN